MGLLGRESALHALFCVVILARLVLVLYHIDRALEPLGEKHGVLPAAWLAKVGLGKAHFSRLFLQVFLEPLGLLVLLRYAWLGQLISQIVERVEKLFPVGSSVLFFKPEGPIVLLRA